MAEPGAGYRRLEGSDRVPVPGGTRVGPADPAERVSVSIGLRRRPGAPPLGGFSQPPARMTHEEFAAVYGADPADIARVEAFADDHGLTVEESSIPRRTVVVSGTVAQLSEAFAVDLGRYEAGEISYRGREGHVYLPAALVPAVEGVFGLDNRPQGRSFAQSASLRQGIQPLTPAGVAKLYGFPAGNAAGQCIGLLEFGGGYRLKDITDWFKEQVLTPPELTDVSVDQVTNSPKPLVKGISPASGPAAGGTPVTITGIDLMLPTGPTAVSVGGAAAVIAPGGTATEITVTSPPGVGTADIVVTTPNGTSPAARFTYTAPAPGTAAPPPPGPAPQITGISPASGPAAGGTAVTITGTGLMSPTGPTAVSFGGKAAEIADGGTDTQITVTSPPGAGTAYIAVVTPDGTSPAATARHFIYTVDLDQEVILDIDVAGAAAQGARIAVYFAPITEQGWVDAVTTAVHDAVNNPSALSISWGWPELEPMSPLLPGWTVAAMNKVSATFQEAALLGVTVLAASGDQGSACQIGDQKAHVEYPASDPYVISCGGTLVQDQGAGAFMEVPWSDRWGASGGGVSASFPVPSWQASAGVPNSLTSGLPGRGVPDVAGNASPSSGYVLIEDGKKTEPAVGGTSAVAPLYAGLVALLNANLNDRVGYLNSALYGPGTAGVFHDVTLPKGMTNGFNGAPGYPVGPGWDAVTGLGSINGLALLNAAPVTRPDLWFAGGGLASSGAGTQVQVVGGSWNGNGVAWAPSASRTPVESPYVSSLAMFRGRMYLAVTDGNPQDGNMLAVFSTDKTMQWGTGTAPVMSMPNWSFGPVSTCGPSLAVFRGRLYVAFRAQFSGNATQDAGNAVLVCSTADGVNWAYAGQTEPCPGSAPFSTSAPSLAAFNGRLYLAFIGLADPFAATVAVRSTADGTTWAAVPNPGTAPTYLNSQFAPSLAVFNGYLYVASSNDSNNIDMWRTADGKTWTGPMWVGQPTQSAVSLAAAGRRLYAAFIPNNSGQAVSLYSTADGQTWTGAPTGFSSSLPPALGAASFPVLPGN